MLSAVLLAPAALAIGPVLSLADAAGSKLATLFGEFQRYGTSSQAVEAMIADLTGWSDELDPPTIG